jgi:hypothetical protein
MENLRAGIITTPKGFIFMNKKVFSVYFLSTMGIFLALVLGTGCETYDSASKTVKSATQKVQDVYKDVVPWESAGGDKLRKRVVVAPFLDQANLGEEKVARLRAEFNAMLEADKSLVVHDIKAVAPTRAKIRSPKYGIVTDPDLEKRAEAMGMNVLVTAIVNPVEIEYRRVGYYPFRWLKKELEVSMVVNATDLINGTLFLTSLESKKVKVPKELQEDKAIEEIMGHEDFTEAVNSILDREASAVRRALGNHPWGGKVLSVSGDKVMISAGEDVGVAVGDIFEVFERGKPIRAAGGTHIFLLGAKVGEVSVTQIMKEHSAATPLSNTPIQAGQVVRLKRK